MEQLRIDKSTFQELVNVNINLYHPLKRFNSYQDFENICTKKKMKNGKFFPIPILSFLMLFGFKEPHPFIFLSPHLFIFEHIEITLQKRT